MKLSKIYEAADKIIGSPRLRIAILKLIDLKLEDDMNTAIKRFESRFESIESKFKTLYWILGLLITLMIALIGIVLTK